MKYHDVCFRLIHIRQNSEEIISSLLTEFAEPADWGAEEFESSEDVINYAKQYIADLMACNCFDPIIRDDAVLVMNCGEVLETSYEKSSLNS